MRRAIAAGVSAKLRRRWFLPYGHHPTTNQGHRTIYGQTVHALIPEQEEGQSHRYG